MGLLAWATFFATAGCAHGRETFDAPPGWQIVAPVTDVSSRQGRCANWSRSEWQVTLDSDGTTPRFAPARDHPVELGVPGGRLVGADRGEWGGQLSWVSENGSASEIYSGNIQAITEVNGRYYAFGGLAHLGINEGRMLRVDRDEDGRWRAVPVVALSGAPEAVAKVAGDTLLVVTSGALEVVHPDGAHRVAHRNPMWGFLYPNSVAVARGGTVYVGMRHAVARLTPTKSGFAEEWIVRDTC
jgi:hypothetical protein